MLLQTTWLIGLLLKGLSIWRFPSETSLPLAFVFSFKNRLVMVVAYITLLAGCGFYFAYDIEEDVVYLMETALLMTYSISIFTWSKEGVEYAFV